MHKRGYFYKGKYYSLTVNDNGIYSDMLRRVKEHNDKYDLKYVPRLRSFAIFEKVYPREITSRGFIFYGNGIDPEYHFRLQVNNLNNLIKILVLNDPRRFKNVDAYITFIENMEKEQEEYHKKQRIERYNLMGREGQKHLNTLDHQNYLECAAKPVEYANAISEHMNDKKTPAMSYSKNKQKETKNEN